MSTMESVVAESSTGGSPLERARALTPFFRERADQVHAESRLTADVVDALRESGLFWASVPQDLGGAGLGLRGSIEVIEEVSRADGSIGWTYMANALTGCFAAGYLPEEGVATLFAGGSLPVGAGMTAPGGYGRKVDGGYQVTGRSRFGSGISHADWVQAGFVLTDDDGAPIMEESGLPKMRMGFVPAADVEIAGNWEVSGFRGTGSFDYEVDDVFIPEALSVDVSAPTPFRTDPIYASGLWGLALMGHVGVALGLMRAALEQVAQITHKKVRGGYPSTVDESPLFLSDFAQKEADFQASRALVMQFYGEVEDCAASGRPLDAVQQSRLRQIPTWITHLAGDVVRACHLWSGTQAFRRESPMARISSDTVVATQHLLVDPITMVDAGGALHAMWRAAD